MIVSCLIVLGVWEAAVWRKRWMAMGAAEVGFEGEVWRLVRQEELVGEIVIDEADFPWLHGRFAPGPAFVGVKPWFDESLALLDAEEYERFEDSYDQIARSLSLAGPSGVVSLVVV
ncbi:hypothetical protein OHV05_26940 [Kitasatospora sp. NBC_00070]|uniref:hypothetical protein n=1 Tax=Kitasatospora sp. NBC_00070 TaxID=2975962 RepID=UPI003252BCBF